MFLTKKFLHFFLKKHFFLTFAYVLSENIVMETNSKQSLINTWSSIFRVLIYVIAVTIILYVLPKEGKFKYEYQKGSPWKH